MSRRGGTRRDRPQRRRQVDAAEGAHADHEPHGGPREIRGRVGSLLEVGTGFHPELTGRENIYLNGAILGMKRREIQAKLPEIVEFSGVESFLDTPVKRYSSGMYVRLAFSVAAHLEPEILLVDEVLAVGDAEFQPRCLGRMEDVRRERQDGALRLAQHAGDRAALRPRAPPRDGRIVLDGPSEEVVAHYLQSFVGAGSSRDWPDLEEAPGDDLVRLRSVRVVRRDGSPADSVDVREPVGIEIAFRVLGTVRRSPPKLKVSAGGRIAFNAMDIDARWHEPTRAGRLRRDCLDPRQPAQRRA